MVQEEVVNIVIEKGTPSFFNFHFFKRNEMLMVTSPSPLSQQFSVSSGICICFGLDLLSSLNEFIQTM